MKSHDLTNYWPVILLVNDKSGNSQLDRIDSGKLIFVHGDDYFLIVPKIVCKFG